MLLSTCFRNICTSFWASPEVFVDLFLYLFFIDKILPFSIWKNCSKWMLSQILVLSWHVGIIICMSYVVNLKNYCLGGSTYVLIYLCHKFEFSCLVYRFEDKAEFSYVQGVGLVIFVWLERFSTSSSWKLAFKLNHICYCFIVQ